MRRQGDATPARGAKRPPGGAKRPDVSLSSPRERRSVPIGGMKAGVLRALVVDDEHVARRVLREELEAQANVEVVGEADGGPGALEKIAVLEPDLVFLDLQMPEMGGFEVIQHLRGGAHVPVIIVVTAYDQYAVRAFDEGAIDYLLKPVGQPRLVRALDRARKLVSSKAAAAENLAKLQEIAGAPASPKPNKIVGRLGDEYYLLNASEVLAFQTDGELVWIVTAKRRYLATKSLTKIQAKLEGTSFRRIHRNTLVNLDHVRKMAALSSNRWLITLNNDQEFVVSKRMAHSVREILSW